MQGKCGKIKYFIVLSTYYYTFRLPTPQRLSMMACLHLSSEVKYDVSEITLLNFLKLIILLLFLKL